MKIEEAQEESAPGSLHILNSVSQNTIPGIESTVSRVFGSLFPNDCILKLPLLQPSPSMFDDYEVFSTYLSAKQTCRS